MPTSETVQAAKAFLRDRILAAAAARHVPLSSAEIAILTYSEPDATPEERACADEVDARIGEHAYERKIEGLIRSAYRRDCAAGMKAEWKAQMRALRKEDMYVLIMAENAGVYKSAALGLSGFLSPDFICLALVAGAGFAFFFLGVGIDAVSSDAARFALFVGWIGAIWMVGEWSRRRIGRD